MSDAIKKVDAPVEGGDAGKFAEECAPAELQCPAILEVGSGMRCIRRAGHDGGHEAAYTERCPMTLTVSLGWDVRCNLPAGHSGMHESRREGEEQPFRWRNDRWRSDRWSDGRSVLVEQQPRTLDEALAERITKSRPITQRAPMKKQQPFFLRFGPRAIEPGQSLTLAMTPQVYFRVEKLQTVGDSSVDILLMNAFVGQRIQNIGTRPGLELPLSAYRNGIEITWDTCQPAFAITLIFRSVAPERRLVDFMLSGRAVA